MQYIFGHKNGLTQALLGLIILVDFHLPLEEYVNKFCYQIINFD